MPAKVLAERGSKNVYRVDTAKPMERISVMYTFGADGHFNQPQLILRRSLSTIPEIAFSFGAKHFTNFLVGIKQYYEFFKLF